jgi:IclR family transcriptional regulator, KDG regulon repressor
MKRSKSDYRIQTVDNAFRVVEEFEADEEIGVTELSRRLSLHKNNVFRILATLEGRGYVEKCSCSDRYRLGVASLRLAQVAGRRRSLVRLGRAVLEELSCATGETAHLATLRCFEVVHLDGERPDQLVGTVLRVGMRLPAHCTALGKVLLASLDGAALERFDRERIQRGGLARRTDETITDREKLLEHLHMVASQGYALDAEECAPGLCCVAAPVYDAGGVAVAALSVSGPSFRLGPKELAERAVPRAVAAAEALSRQLGYTGA